MVTSDTGPHVISAKDLLKIEFPDVEYFWSDVLRRESRVAIIGKPKTAKSFFSIQLGLCISRGLPFLGSETSAAKVMYINFEISQEKLQERIVDVLNELNVDPPEDFSVCTLYGLALEDEGGWRLLNEAVSTVPDLDVLIIDPRRQSMAGDENQSEIMTQWAHNVDRIRTDHGLCIVVVHHEGKDTRGAGRGSSVFDGWLDTMMHVRPGSDYQDVSEIYDLQKVRLEIKGRDTEQRVVDMAFDYPIWRPSEKQASNDLNKVESASIYINNIVPYDGSSIKLSDLRMGAVKDGFTPYSFGTALKQLCSRNILELIRQPNAQGNVKCVRRISLP